MPTTERSGRALVTSVWLVLVGVGGMAVVVSTGRSARLSLTAAGVAGSVGILVAAALALIPLARRWGALYVELASAAVALGLYLGVPDTEAPVAVLAALGVAGLGSLLQHWWYRVDATGSPRSWADGLGLGPACAAAALAPMLVGAAVVGSRGRPPTLSGALACVATLVVAGVVRACFGRSRSCGSWWIPIANLVALALASTVIARLGIVRADATRLVVVTGLVALGLSTSLVMSELLDRRLTSEPAPPSP